jgi:hypothetical protein
VLYLSRVDRTYLHVPVAVTLADGTAADPAAVALALLPPSTPPTGGTVWQPATVTDGQVTVLLAGPDADPTDAVPVPLVGGDLWLRIDDNPEVQAVRVPGGEVAVA